MSATFQKLTFEGMCSLRPLLEEHLPFSTQMFNIVDLHTKQRFPHNAWKTTIYSIPDTNVVSVIWKPSNSLRRINPSGSLLYVPPPSAPASSLCKPIDEESAVEAYLKLIDWDRPHIFEAVSPHFLPHLENIILVKNGIIKQKVNIKMYFMPEESVKKLEGKTNTWEERLGDKFEMGKINRGSYTPKMNRYSKYQGEDGARIMAEALRMFGCARGVFLKGQQNKKGLVSWCILTPMGRVGQLYTLDAYRGQGLGQWSFEETCKKVVERYGIIPCFEVEEGNEAGYKLVEKLGMQLIGDVHWINYLPPVIAITRRRTVTVGILKFL